ncbi:hypothetical protein XAC2852_300082 [Xanthomonas citri pv. citri]|nr:hypothetical protein XAC2852_300082 [Xanthomonas citri pv. citri]
MTAWLLSPLRLFRVERTGIAGRRCRPGARAASTGRLAGSLRRLVGGAVGALGGRRICADLGLQRLDLAPQVFQFFLLGNVERAQDTLHAFVEGLAQFVPAAHRSIAGLLELGFHLFAQLIHALGRPALTGAFIGGAFAYQRVEQLAAFVLHAPERAQASKPHGLSRFAKPARDLFRLRLEALGRVAAVTVVIVSGRHAMLL